MIGRLARLFGPKQPQQNKLKKLKSSIIRPHRHPLQTKIASFFILAPMVCRPTRMTEH